MYANSPNIVYKKFNNSRTNLLIITFKELIIMKKECEVKINSRSLSTAEKEFSCQNDHIVNLKIETFSNRLLTKGVHHAKSNNNLIKVDLTHNSFTKESTILRSHSPIKYSSPDFSSNNNSYKKKLYSTRKTSISQKKNEFFNTNTLSKFQSEFQLNGNKKSPVSSYKKCVPSPTKNLKNTSSIDLFKYKNIAINLFSEVDNKDKEKLGLNYLRKLAKTLIKKRKTFKTFSLPREKNNLEIVGSNDE